MGYGNTPECFVFNDGQNSNALAAMANGGMMGGAWNNPLWALIFLAFLRNGDWFGGNNGNNCATQSQLSQIQDTLNTNQGQNTLMAAIQGSHDAVRNLATHLDCDFNAVNMAINGVQQAISNLGSKNDMNSMQVINAINSGNSMLANQLSSCCCDVKQLVTNFGYESQINNLQQSTMIQKGFGDLTYATQSQTNSLMSNADANARAVLAKLDAMEDSRKDREINALTAQLASANARAERQAELAPIMEAIKEVQCKQPTTTTVPYQPFVAVPNCVAWNASLNGAPFGNGIFG